jgi:malic enzyme
VAAVGGAFTQEVVGAMAAINAQPIVFALSNPTSKAECTAEQAYAWSGGRALFACGSPFDPVTLNGKRFVPRQGNNSYIFPGMGLAAILTCTSRITDPMFMAAARTLAAQVTDADLRAGQPLSRAQQHPPGLGGHRHGGRHDRLPREARGRAGARGHPRVREGAHVRARIRAGRSARAMIDDALQKILKHPFVEAFEPATWRSSPPSPSR